MAREDGARRRLLQVVVEAPCLGPGALRQRHPLRQRMALTQRAGAEAQRFYEYLQQPSARTVFARHGFALPTD